MFHGSILFPLLRLDLVRGGRGRDSRMCSGPLDAARRRSDCCCRSLGSVGILVIPLDLGGVDLTEPIEQTTAFLCRMQADGLGDGILAAKVRISNEELGGALKAFEEPLIQGRIDSPAVPAIVELDYTVQRQFVEYRRVDASF